MTSNSTSNFYRRSSMFGVLSLLAAALNYALYPIIARILNPVDFGNFTLIVALSNQILAVLLAFNIINIYLVKSSPETTAREKAQIIQKVLIWLICFITVLVLLLSPLLKSWLKVDNPMAFLILAIILLTTVPSVIWSGYLQGHKKIHKVGIYTFSGSAGKFLLAIVMAIVWGVTGALWGVVLGGIVGLITLRLTAGIKLPKLTSVLAPLDGGQKTFIKELLPYILACVFVVGGLGFLQNIDIIYAKALFDKHIAGVYSGISILSNAIYYGAFLLVWIVLPEIDIKNDKTNRRVLGTAYKILALLAAGGLLFELAAKNFLTQKLLGAEFASQGPVLIFATLFQLSLVSVALYAFYSLVMRRYRIIWLGVLVILLCTIMPWFFHDSPKQMIISLWLSVLLGAAIYGIISRNFVRGKNE